VFVQHPDERYAPLDPALLYRLGTRSVNDGRPCIDIPAFLRAGTGVDTPVEFSLSRYRGNPVVTYWLAYGYNDKTAFGDHDADEVRVAVEYVRHSYHPVAVWYYQHGRHQERIPYDELMREQRREGHRDPRTGRSPAADGHPVAYDASGSHEPYPRPGHYPIGDKHLPLVGTAHFATDEAADSGRVVDAGARLRPEPHRSSPGGPTTKIGCDGPSPDEPGTGANAEPDNPRQPVETRPPKRGDGIDGTLRRAVDAAGRPITLPLP